MSLRVVGSKRCPSVKAFVLVGTAFAVAGWAGCNSPASRTGSGAATGATLGAATGLLVGSNSNIGPLAGLAGGAAAGAGIGAIVGAIKQSKENKEQAEMAQERVYQAERAARMKEEQTQKIAMENELAVAQGFQITDVELQQAIKRREEAESQLKSLTAEMNDAAAKTKALKDAQDKTLELEAQIASTKETLSRLKGDQPTAPGATDKEKETTSGAAAVETK